jgi:predicted SnoaL-like aldol condensation-catalyzing enzyme
MSDSAKDLVYKVYHEIFNKRQPQLCDTLFDENCTLHLRRKEAIHGRDQYKKYVEKWLQENPDLKYDIQDIVAEGNKVAVRWEEHDTSKDLHSRAQIFLIIVDNKVMEGWEVWENLKKD